MPRFDKLLLVGLDAGVGMVLVGQLFVRGHAAAQVLRRHQPGVRERWSHAHAQH